MVRLAEVDRLSIYRSDELHGGLFNRSRLRATREF